MTASHVTTAQRSWGLLCLGLIATFAGVAAPADAAENGRAEIAIEHEGALVLGEIERVAVTLTVPEPAALAALPLRVAVNVGAFEPLTRIAPGVYRTNYRLPAQRFPQIALIAVWRETGPDAEVSVLRIPLHGRTEIPVTTRPHAQVTASAGAAPSAPQVADGRGLAKISLVVPPGVDKVRVESVDGDEKKEAWVNVSVPPYNRLTLAVTPGRALADGKTPVTAFAIYEDRPGAPPRADRIRLEATGGAVTRLDPRGAVHRFLFTPAPDTSRSVVTLRAQVADDPASRREVTLEVESTSPALAAAPGPPLPLADVPSEPRPEAPIQASAARAASTSIALRVGLAHDARVVPLGGLGLEWRPPVLDRALRVFIAASYRQTSVRIPSAELPSLRATLRRVPLSAGATYDLFATGRIRLYGGAAFVASAFSHAVASEPQRSETSSWWAPGGELLLGGAYAGLFLEGALSYVRVDRPEVRAPALAITAALGYRFDLF